MQTFQNNIDVTFKSFPQTPEQWLTDPTIKFTVAKDRIVHKGDRIFCASKMLTSGPNTGSIREIYYYVTEIIEVEPNRVHITNTDITATAKRLEL